MPWYYLEGREQKGPVDDAEFRRLIDAQVIRDQTPVWREGMAEWQTWDTLADDYSDLAIPAQDDSGVCAECGRIYPSDQLVQYGDARVCANCKDLFFQKVMEGVPVAGDFRYGGFWIRGLALFIDGAILGFANILINTVFTSLVPEDVGQAEARGLVFAVMALVFLLQTGVACAYATWFVGRFAATPGKMACGLRVVMPDGGRVTYWRAFGRYFAEILSALILYIGYIMAAFDEEKRTLHDRICNTRVVRK